jgi:dTMP kinase
MAQSSEWLLYMAARAQLVHERVRPALQNGRTVVCDRFVLSTYAYQGHGLGAPLDAIRTAAAAAVGDSWPHLSIVLDVDPATGLARAGGEPDRIEARGADYLARVRDGFLAEAAAASDRVVVIDAGREPDAVWADVRGVVLERLDGSEGAA